MIGREVEVYEFWCFDVELLLVVQVMDGYEEYYKVVYQQYSELDDVGFDYCVQFIQIGISCRENVQFNDQ